MRNHQYGFLTQQPFKTLVVTVVFPEHRVIRSKTVDERCERVLAFQNVLFFWSLDTLTREFVVGEGSHKGQVILVHFKLLLKINKNDIGNKGDWYSN